LILIKIRVFAVLENARCPLFAAGAARVSSRSSFMKAFYVLTTAAVTLLPISAIAQISPETLRSCLGIEDQTKERLDCCDEKIKPEPKKVSAPAKSVQDCRFVKEEDERLNCFNQFVNSPPKKKAVQQSRKPTAGGGKGQNPPRQ
jgi:hypothetical protein